MKNLPKTILTLIAVSITIGTTWCDHRPVISKKAHWDDVRAEAQAGGYRLITTDKLWQQFNANRFRRQNRI